MFCGVRIAVEKAGTFMIFVGWAHLGLGAVRKHVQTRGSGAEIEVELRLRRSAWWLDGLDVMRQPAGLENSGESFAIEDGRDVFHAVAAGACQHVQTEPMLHKYAERDVLGAIGEVVIGHGYDVRAA